jgi:hypothetical protein
MGVVMKKVVGKVRVALPVAVVGVGTLVVSSLGIATAASGGTFMLGKVNAAKRTSTLSSKHGAPLSLKAPTGAPPLQVNSSVQVPKLNSQYLGGLTAGQLQKRVIGTCATGIDAVGATGAVGCAGEKIFQTSGTLTVPANVSELTVMLWGSGGNGGTGTVNVNTLSAYHGGGGGAGAYEEVLVAVTPGQHLTLTVGSGGSDTTLTGNDGSTVIASAGGGHNGGNAPSNSDGTPGQGGAPGTPSGSATGLVGTNGAAGSGSSGAAPGFAGAGGNGGYPAAGSPGADGLAIVSFTA